MVWGKSKHMEKVDELISAYEQVKAGKIPLSKFRAMLDSYRMDTRKFLGITQFLDKNIEEIQQNLHKKDADAAVERLLSGTKNCVSELKNHL